MTAPVRWRDLAPPLAVLALAVVFLVWAQDYRPRTRAVPTLVAWVAIALALIDAAAQFETPWGRLVRRFTAARSVVEWKPQGGEGAAGRRVAAAILWPVGYVAVVAAAGFLIATPIYVLLYMTWHGRKSLRASAIAAAALTAALWLGFEVLLRYPLYPGLLFGGE